ncbi:MAG: 30S ribosomal protein S11 [Patescibacteria group bacterium]
MGKKRIIKKSGQDLKPGASRSATRSIKRKLERGILHINSTYNNTGLLLTDTKGGAVASSSAGALGFKGSKKGTPFAAGKVGELLSEQAEQAGLKDLDVVIKGVGAGRESALRSFVARGFIVHSIVDKTPVPFNGPRPPKPRRV